MKFCLDCHNKANIKIDPATKKVIYFCRCCGWEDDHGVMLEDPCIYSSKLDEEDTISTNIINEYTKLDPTLPRIKTITCPNDSCPSHSTKDSEIIYIKYDYKNMKYVYLCTRCDFSWKTSGSSGSA